MKKRAVISGICGRVCAFCGNTYYRRKHESPARFDRSSVCSNACRINRLRSDPNANGRHKKTQAKLCEHCGEPYNRKKRECLDEFAARRFCSHSCYAKHNSSSQHYAWRGGLRLRPDGYVRATSAGDKYIHRLIMESHIGRPLLKNEVVHHINGDTSDNRVCNLVVLTNSEHRKLHCADQPRGAKGEFVKCLKK